MKGIFRPALAAACGLAGVLLLMVGLRSVKAAPPAPRPPADPAAHAVRASSPVTPTLFHDVSVTAGLTAPIQLQHMPGQAWADVNRDGWPDLYLTGGINPNVLILNDGSGGFTVAPFSADVALTGTTSGGAVFGDYNNDGWPDLYVLANSEGGLPGNALLRNDGGTHFTDVTTEAGVGDAGVGTSGSWGDYDLDGDLDLYVANWYCSDCPNGSRDTLYRNDGDGTFTDMSHLLGASLEGPGFIASFLDYDNDGDLDIYLVNDKAFSGPPPPPHPGHNILWRNDGAGCAGWCFTDVSVSAGAAVAVDGMGLAIGDYDNDGDLDMYFSNAGPQVLLQNQTSQGSPTFVDVSAAAGVAFDAIGWGTVFLDYDNDGLRDLYLATMNGSPALANRLYRNAGNGTFIDVSAVSGADDTGQTFGVAYADYDHDGWTDLVIGNLGEPYTLFRNQAVASPGNAWLSVQLGGGGPVNRDAIGARVQVRTDDGVVQMQEVKSGSSLGSGNALELNFGVGPRSVEAMTVTWPGGFEQVWSSVLTNSLLLVDYPLKAPRLSKGISTAAAPGSVQQYEHLLTNISPMTDTIVLDLHSSRSWASVSPVTHTLGAGQQVPFTVTVSIPDPAEGVETTILTATSMLDPQVFSVLRDTTAVLSGTQVFSDVSVTAGISATHHRRYWITGQAWGDFNGDGWVDLYLTDNGDPDAIPPVPGPNRLYHNNGDGTFSLSVHNATVALTDTMSGGAVFADYNNDGWRDLYVLNWGANKLFRNDQGQGFSDVTGISGLGDEGIGATAAWGDIDGDGYLDLYVANHACLNCPNGYRDGMYRSNGDGTFTDISEALGPGAYMPSLTVSFVDYDNDGDLDIYMVSDKGLGNPAVHNVLWRNDGAGCASWCYTDVSVSSGADSHVNGMGLAVGDYDQDGDLDFYFSNSGPAVLLQNQTSQGSPTFVDQAGPAGVDLDAVHWGTFFFDYNNDGWQDLYLATMETAPSLTNRLYHNGGNGMFADVSTISGASAPGASLGTAYADYNNDGQMDMVVGNSDERYYLFKNEGNAGLGHHWLQLDLIGAGPVNRDAIGARAYLQLSNGQRQMQEVKSGSSFGSGNDLTLHFGLGNALPVELRVIWPDGLEETLVQIPVDQTWSLAYPQPGLTWSPAQFHIAAPDQTITYTFALTNTGLRQEEISLALSCVQGWGQLEAQTMPIDAGAFAEVRVVVSLPAGATGSEACTLTAASGLDPIYQQSVDLQVAIASSIIRLPWVEK